MRVYDTPPDVLEPTEVKFDQIDGNNDKFVFAIAASGWHTAALVIDMSPGTLPKSSSKTNVPPGSGDDGENDVDQVVETMTIAAILTTDPRCRVPTHRCGGEVESECIHNLDRCTHASLIPSVPLQLNRLRPE